MEGNIVTPQQPPPATAPNPGDLTTPPSNVPPVHVKKAHRFLMVYVFVLAAALLGGGIYAWQNSKVNELSAAIKKQNLEIANLKKQLASYESQPITTNEGNQANNPFAGWKTFCDTVGGACFRYPPKDWVITGTSSASKTQEALDNATKTAVVQYENPYTADSQDQVYYISEIQDLRVKSLKLKIVGRVQGNTPTYVVVDAAYVSANHIAAGKTISFANNARFSSVARDVKSQFIAMPTGAAQNNIKNTDQAVAWFKTDDGKNTLAILQSLYYQ